MGVGGKNQIDPDESLYKYGWANAEHPELIQWVVRVNYSKQNIQNAVYEDFIGPKQVVDFNSIKAFHGEFDPDDNFTPGAEVPSSAITQTTEGFKVDLGNLTDSVKISYYTTSTDNGASPNYTNKGQLTGDNFIKQEIEVATPTSGGGGGGEGTTGSVELTKTDDSSQKNPLEGAEFKLVNGAGTIVQTGLKTNIDGKLTISNLKYDTYQLIETKAPQGYVLDASPVEFTIDDAHQSLFLSKENSAIKGSVSLEKVDHDTQNLLADAEFELQDKDGNTLQPNLKTDKMGKLTVTDLLPGEYQFVETKAPTGYILDATPVKFKISTEALNVTVTKENTKKPEIPKVPVPPKTPEQPDKPDKPDKPEQPDKIISADSKRTTLPKTGDTPLVNGWGILLVAISASGLIALRRK